MSIPTKEILEFFPNSKYLPELGTNTPIQLHTVVMDIEKRLNDLEYGNKKNKRKKVFRAQKFLLLYHLGMLEKLIDLPISKDKKAKLLSLILDEDKDNLEGDLQSFEHPNSDLKKDFNYEFLISVFTEVGLNNLVTDCEKVLTKIKTQKEKKDKK